MKTRFYLLTIFVFFALAVSAQKYNGMLTEEWMNNAWTNSFRSTYTHDLNGNVLKLTTQGWNAESSSWGNSASITNTLNSDGTIMETITQVWDTIGSTYMDISKIIYTYSASKKVLTQTSQIMFVGTWMDFSKTVYTYNGNDLLTTEVTQTSNFITPDLTNSSQTTFSYNSDGTLNQDVVQIWSVLYQWVNSNRNTNTYNASKQITSSLSEKWVTDAWSNESRETYTYNSAGLITESVGENWLNNAWVNATKSMLSYNGTNDLAQIIIQDWNTTLAQWENKTRTTFNYNTTGINPVQLSGKVTLIYPNPFNDQLTIQSESLDEHLIQIFNATGQVVHEFKTSKTATNLNLGWLNKGVYFMKINSPNKEQTIKLLKAR